MAWASTSPVASSTLASSSTTGWPPATPSWPAHRIRVAIAVPTTTCTALGRPSISRLPAPNPVASMRMAGSGPHPTRWRPAVPRPSVSSARRGRRPRRSARPASMPRPRGPGWGAGRGRPGSSRCRWPPGWHARRRSPSTSRAAAVPTTSTMASSPPTSWKWTCSGGRRWSRPSTSASARNVASARRATRSGRRASSTRPVMCDAVRTTAVSGACTCAWVAAMPPRSTGSASSPQPPTGSRASRARTSSRSAPASSSDPSAMSPAIPEKQWNQATVRGLVTTSPRLGALGPSCPAAKDGRRRSFEHPEHGAGGAEAVVDADHGEAGGAGRRASPSSAVTPPKLAP